MSAPATLDDDFVGRLRCPVTGSLLVRLPSAALAQLNGAILAKTALTRAGKKPERPLSAALVTADGWAYPVLDGIPVLLADDAIAVS